MVQDKLIEIEYQTPTIQMVMEEKEVEMMVALAEVETQVVIILIDITLEVLVYLDKVIEEGMVLEQVVQVVHPTIEVVAAQVV